MSQVHDFDPALHIEPVEPEPPTVPPAQTKVQPKDTDKPARRLDGDPNTDKPASRLD